EKLEELTTWIGGLNFPLNLPFNLKQRGEDKKNIFNDGHVDTPVEVVFKGPAINPKIVNQTTGKFIQVNRELTSEDTLYITTQYRNKKVEIERNGVRTNAFNYIDLDSTFFNLSVGDNLIEYSTQSLEPQGVSIKYSQKYLGV
ncbi:MAG: phage tail family protein, partial [Peptostreptococcaceae bacterium]|nr:phage tail family protein [Peptostreptococcaceae bacterium]